MFYESEKELVYSIYHEYFDRADTLLASNVYINCCSPKSGLTPMHAASTYKSIKPLQYLIGKGANVNVTDIHRRTPIMYAIEHNQLEHVMLLIDSNANTAMTDKKGNSLIHYATTYGSLEMLTLILDRCKLININGINKEGLSAVDISIKLQRYNMLTLLLKHKAKAQDNAIDAVIANDDIVGLKILLDMDRTSTVHDTRCTIHSTLLHTCALHNSIKCATYMLNTRIVSASKYDCYGKDALSVACEYYHRAMIVLLMNAHINITANSRNDNYLHLVCKYDDVELVEMFILKGMSVHDINDYGYKPIDVAIEHHCTNVINYLSTIMSKDTNGTVN